MSWFRRLALIIAILLLLVIAGVFTVAKSERVGRWVFSSLEAWTNGLVIATDFEGALLGDFRLGQLVIDTGYERIQLSNLNLHTGISSEFQILVTQAQIGTLNITISERPTSNDTNTDEANTDNSLPTVYIPVDIVVTNLELANFDLTVFEEAILTDLSVDADVAINGSNIDIIALQTSLYEQPLSAKGSLRLADIYPIDMAVELTVAQTTPMTVAQIHVSDSVTAPKVDISADGWLTGHALVDLPRWNALGKIPVSAQIKLGALGNQSFIAVPESLSDSTVSSFYLDGAYDAGVEAAITSDFNLPVYEFSGHLETEFTTDFDKLWLESLALKPTDDNSSGQINASGELALTELAAELEIAWQDLAWPLVESQYQFPSGNIALSGDFEDFTAVGVAAVTVLGIGSAQANVDLRAVESELTINQFALVGEFGEVVVAGRANWGDQQDIDVDLSLGGFDLALLNPELQSSISAQATLKASGIDTPEANVAIQDLAGSFRQMPLAGSGEVSYSDSCWAISDLALYSNDNFLTADGSVCSNQTLGFEFAIAELREWRIPEVSGDIQGAAELRFGATLAELALAVNSQTQSLKYGEDVALSNASVQASVTLNDEAEVLSVVVTADELEYMHVDVNALEISVDGTLAEHQFKIKHGEVSPELHGVAVSGSGNYEQLSWQGRIDDIEIDAQRAWRLNEAFDVAVSEQDVMINPFCLRATGEAKFCAGIDIRAQQLQSAELQVASVPIAWASPFLPFLSNADNLIATDIRYQFKPSGSDFFGEATLSGNSLTLVSRGGVLMNAPVSNARLAAQLAGDTITLNGSSRLSETGNLVLDAELSSLLSEPKVDAQLTASLDTFDWLDDTLSSVEDLSASVTLEASAQGPLDNPRISALAVIEAGNLVLSEYGTRVEQFNTRLTLVPDWQISVAGGANIGGDIEWEGEFDGQSGDLALRLDGEELRLAQSARLSVLASPSIQLVAEQGNLTMTGNLDIIDGNYHLDDAPEVVTTSSDVVYVDEQFDAEANSILPERLALDFNLNIRPGFRVTSNDFFSDVGGRLELKKPIDSSLRAFGTINISSGEYQVYSSRMPIKSGRISFSGGAIDNPSIDILVEKKVDDVVVGVEVKGTSLDPTVELYSQPYMSDTERLSYLVFETPPSDDTAAQLAFMQATEMIGAGTRVNDLLGEATFTISPTKASIGRQLNADFWVGFNYFLDSAGQQSTHSNDDNTEFLIRYRVNNNITVEASMGEDQGIDAYYTLETDDP